MVSKWCQESEQIKITGTKMMKISYKMYEKTPKLRYRTQVRSREGGRTVGSGKVATIVE